MKISPNYTIYRLLYWGHPDIPIPFVLLLYIPPLGHFVPWDVLSQGRFILGRFVLGRFVLGCFVPGTFCPGMFFPGTFCLGMFCMCMEN